MNACESVSDDACSFDAMTQYDLLNKNYNSEDHFFVLPFFFSCNHFTPIEALPWKWGKALSIRKCGKVVIWSVKHGHVTCEHELQRLIR